MSVRPSATRPGESLPFPARRFPCHGPHCSGDFPRPLGVPVAPVSPVVPHWGILEVPSAPALLESRLARVENDVVALQFALSSVYRPPRWDGAGARARFTGKEEDAEVGLAYFGARYYAPNLAQWLSPDPLTVHGLGLPGLAVASSRMLNAGEAFPPRKAFYVETLVLLAIIGIASLGVAATNGLPLFPPLRFNRRDMTAAVVALGLALGTLPLRWVTASEWRKRRLSMLVPHGRGESAHD